MSDKSQGHVPGSSMASQAEFDRMVYKYGKSCLSIGHHVYKYASSGNAVRALRFKAPPADGGDWLAIVTVTLNGDPAVAFVFGESFAACVSAVANQFGNGSLKWKEDQYG